MWWFGTVDSETNKGHRILGTSVPLVTEDPTLPSQPFLTVGVPTVVRATINFPRILYNGFDNNQDLLS